MASSKKGPADRVEARTTLAAVLLADSFTQRFRPITIERPKVLLPLVNVPMIEYTLEWLAMNKVEEVYVFCCAHAEQVKKYLAESKWAGGTGGMRVITIVATNCLSAGEALRAIDQRDIIKSDFILVSGDTVSNMSLKRVLEEHKARRAVDKNAIMTMVMKPMVQHAMQRLRMGEGEQLVVATDPSTHRLLKYHEMDNQHSSSSLQLDAAYFSERDAVKVRTDLLDCQIAVCAPEVLMLFSDNFDYQNIKQDFVTGVLSEEELGNKLYIYECSSEYAAHIHNLRTYDAVSRDIMQRWAFPFVPDTNVLYTGGTWGASSYRYGRNHVYCESQVQIQRSAHITNDVCIGAGTSVGDNTKIAVCVIGRNCRIGKNVSIHGCYIQDNVTIKDNTALRSAMVCEGAMICTGAKLEPGAIVSYRAIIGPNHTLASNTRVSLCKQLQAEGSDSDDDLEYASTSNKQRARTGFGNDDDDDEDDDDGYDEDEEEDDAECSSQKPSEAVLKAAATLSALCLKAEEAGARRQSGSGGLPKEAAACQFDKAAVGEMGAGFVWHLVEGFDVARYSIAAPNRSMSLYTETEDAEASGAHERGGGRAGGADAHDDASASDDDSDEEMDPDAVFKREVSETFMRCVKMKFDQTNAVIELNGLKIAEDRSFADCARYIFTTMLAMCLPAPPRVAAGEYGSLFPTTAPDTTTQEGKLALLRLFKAQLKEWTSLLQRFLRNEDDQVELLLTLEEYCSEEGVFEGCGEKGKSFAEIFPQVLQQLYDADVISEEAFLAWADEKEHADASDRLYLNKASKFIDWLRTADEDNSDEEDVEDEEDD